MGKVGDDKEGDKASKGESPADENLTPEDKGHEELVELQEVNKVVAKKPIGEKQRKKIYRRLTGKKRGKVKLPTRYTTAQPPASWRRKIYKKLTSDSDGGK